MKFELKDNDQLYSEFGYNERENFVYFRWYDEISISDMRVLVRFAKELQEELKCPYLVNDNSTLKTNWQELNDWVEANYLPEVVEHGLKYFAHVVSPNFYPKVSAIDLHRRMKGKLEMQFFQDWESAVNWIKACQSDELNKKFMNDLP